LVQITKKRYHTKKARQPTKPSRFSQKKKNGQQDPATQHKKTKKESRLLKRTVFCEIIPKHYKMMTLCVRRLFFELISLYSICAIHSGGNNEKQQYNNIPDHSFYIF
jgi:hypothetical protein